MSEFLKPRLGETINLEEQVEWGALDPSRPHLGVLKSNPNVVVRYCGWIGADSYEEAQANIDVAQAEHQRLRSCGVRIPIYTSAPCQEADDNWNAYLLSPRLFGEQPKPPRPDHAPYLVQLARSLLRYYGATPPGGQFLSDVMDPNQYTLVPKGSGATLSGLYLHDIDPFVNGSGPILLGGRSRQDCVYYIRCWLQDLPYSEVRQDLITQTEKVYRQLQ